jgi:DNA-binding response OmpR family regulator
MLSRVQSFCCPSCGGYIGEAAAVDTVRESISAPAKRLIFDMLTRRVGRPVLKDAIIEAVYGSRSDGGPDNASTIVQVLVSQLRRQIEPYGWTISNSRGGAGELAQWKLIPTERGP